MSERLANYGGQAVIEGVMMRGSQVYAVAVRTPDQGIRIETDRLGSLYRGRFARLPLLRGLLILWDALVLGIRALTFSADIQAGEDEKIGVVPWTLTMLGSLAAGIALFFLLPAGIGYLSESLLGLPAWWANIVEGVMRLLLLIGYIWAIGRLPEIQRVFSYHGAEHMTINAYEAGAPLEVGSVARFPLEHPRCGTAFLLTVAILSIALFGALGPLPLGTRMISRILLIPVVAALAYEYLRFTANVADRPWARPLLAPNLALQRLTTRRPEDSMLEVAIAAFQAMRQGEADPEAVT
jgi:uncharacterized protein YqhQ